MDTLEKKFKGAFSKFRRGFQTKIVDAEEMVKFVAFCHEVEGVVGYLAAKYHPSVGRAESRRHQVVKIYPMVIKEIGLIHKQLLRLMRVNIPRRNVRISRDMPDRIFEEVLALLTTNSFKTVVKRTRATTTITITCLEKALVFFNFWAKDEGTLERKDLMRKVDRQGNSMVVVVGDQHPMTMTMRHNSNRFFLFVKFEVVNKFGVVQ